MGENIMKPGDKDHLMGENIMKPGDKDPRMQKIIDNIFDKIYPINYKPKDFVMTIDGVPIKGFVMDPISIQTKEDKK